MFGVGLNRPLESDLAGHVLWALKDAVLTENVDGIVPDIASVRFAPLVVSLDVPSGMCSDSGIGLGENAHGVDAAFAHLTVTFHAPKVGHFVDSAGWGQGPYSSGELRVVDIGLRTETDDNFVSLSTANHLHK